MVHPKYQVKAVNVTKGKQTEEIVSKFLMYKDEANRMADYLNRHESVFNDDDNCHYYIVVERVKQEKGDL